MHLSSSPSPVAPPLRRRLVTFAAVALASLACAGGEDAGDAEAAGRQPDSAATAAARDPIGATTLADSLVKRADLARIMGDSAAPVWMIVVSDFQCPFCARWHASVDSTVRAEYVRTGKIRMAFVNFPLPQHQHAMRAAETAMCAGAQGKFWEMHDHIFETQQEWSGAPDATPIFLSAAGRLGLDSNALQACISSGRMRPMIEADYQKARSSGARSTPTFFIGGTTIAGAEPVERFRTAIEAALAQASAAGRGKQ